MESIAEKVQNKLTDLDTSERLTKQAFKDLFPELLTRDCQFTMMDSSGVHFKLELTSLTFSVNILNYDSKYEINASERLSDLLDEYDECRILYNGDYIMSDD